jgi:transcriptional regulator with XRE-family HTH domain
MLELYENIRARRIALHMTQQELAKKLGYKSTSTIAKIESGTLQSKKTKTRFYIRNMIRRKWCIFALA